MFGEKIRERTSTICWMCVNATGRCSWSEDLIPVEGWIAEPTKIKITDNQTLDSFKVLACPLFVQDSTDNGQKRLNCIKKGATV